MTSQKCTAMQQALDALDQGLQFVSSKRAAAILRKALEAPDAALIGEGCTGSNEPGQPGSAYPAVCHGITGTALQGVEPSVNTSADAVQAAVLVERERCALVADAISNKYAYGFYGNEVDTADEIADAIRKGPQ